MRKSLFIHCSCDDPNCSNILEMGRNSLVATYEYCGEKADKPHQVEIFYSKENLALLISHATRILEYLTVVEDK